jgi:2Fe-2S ferredoxin
MRRGVSSLFRKNKRVDIKEKILLTVLPEQIVVEASQGDTVLQALLDANIEIDHSCGGMGTCGTCRMYVEKGLEKFGDPNEAEKEIRSDRNFEPNERLSCQNLVVAGLVLRKP